MEWPDGPRLFEFFRDLPGPLRIPDVPAYVRALGFSPDDRLPSKTFQGTPMRHLGVHVGNFYLVEKAGGEAFTDEDEELLVLFAAQAATAIAYRAGRRARADLEALIETSPVGVVVFEARTGALVSLNREAARIVKSLCDPGQSAEQLLGVITCRRADGREIALDRLPLARALDRAETVRAEEVVLSVPDGRSVTTLINATPIRDPDGPDDALASVVVTLQDLAPLREIERMRAFRKYSTAGDRAGGLGSGLGLAICKGLVEAQGGRIRAESGGVGLGARFTFTIPVAEAAGDSPAPARPGPPGHAPEAVPILVVDDDPETLRQVRDTLAEAGYAPLVTGDPGAAARLIRAEKPRLVLLDLMLPGTDGIELMQSVPELSDLPVIFISGYGRDETIARALEAGRRGLRGQAVLADRAHGAHPGGPAPAV